MVSPPQHLLHNQNPSLQLQSGIRKIKMRKALAWYYERLSTRQGTSSQYQNSYLDLAVWYWYSICQLNKNISKYWDGNAIYCQLLQPTNVNTTLCHRTDWDPLLCGCLSPDKVDLGFMKLALFPSRTLFQPSKNNRNSRWTNTLIRHQFSGNTMHLFIWTKENKYGQVFFYQALFLFIKIQVHHFTNMIMF